MTETLTITLGDRPARYVATLRFWGIDDFDLAFFEIDDEIRRRMANRELVMGNVIPSSRDAVVVLRFSGSQHRASAENLVRLLRVGILGFDPVPGGSPA